ARCLRRRSREDVFLKGTLCSRFVALVAAKSSASHLCIDGALKCNTVKVIRRLRRNLGNLWIVLLVSWFAHGVKDFNLTALQRTAVEVDKDGVNSQRNQR